MAIKRQKADEESAAIPGLFVARSSFAVATGETSRVVRKGTVVREGDPVLKGRDGLFEPFVPEVSDFSSKV